MVIFSMTFMDPLPGFQCHGIFEADYLENSASYGQSNRKPYLTYGMVPCLVTLTDL